MKISDLLTRAGTEFVTVTPGDRVKTAAGLMKDRKKGLAAVVDAEGTLLGVLSVIDVNRGVADHGERAPAMSVRELMNADVVVCAPSDSVEDALSVMTTAHIRHLPVVESGVLRGMVNLRSLLKIRFEQAQMSLEEMQGYIFGVGYH